MLVVRLPNNFSESVIVLHLNLELLGITRDSHVVLCVFALCNFLFKRVVRLRRLVLGMIRWAFSPRLGHFSLSRLKKLPLSLLTSYR